jgi:hypothetical protein
MPAPPYHRKASRCSEKPCPHDTTPDGLPLGKVFAGTDKAFGTQWTVTASHELLEMLGDPAINLTALSMTPFEIAQNVVGQLYAYEGNNRLA